MAAQLKRDEQWTEDGGRGQVAGDRGKRQEACGVRRLCQGNASSRRFRSRTLITVAGASRDSRVAEGEDLGGSEGRDHSGWGIQAGAAPLADNGMQEAWPKMWQPSNASSGI